MTVIWSLIGAFFIALTLKLFWLAGYEHGFYFLPSGVGTLASVYAILKSTN